MESIVESAATAYFRELAGGNAGAGRILCKMWTDTRVHSKRC